MKNINLRLTLCTYLIFQALFCNVLFASANYEDVTHRKIVVSKIRGGFGNQLFQYAAGYSLSQRLNADFILAQRDPVGKSFSPTERGFVLDIFGIKYDQIMTYQAFDELMRAGSMSRLRIKEIDITTYFHIMPEESDVFVCTDFFTSHIFYAASALDIRKQFQFKAPREDLAHFDKISTTQSVAVHFRRGDYVPLNWHLDLDYQLRAITNMRRLAGNLHFFLFSDDTNFLESIIGSLKDATIVSCKTINSIDEFFLMSSCKHMITSNSTFSWWAAWLNANPHKIIITPSPKWIDTIYGAQNTQYGRTKKSVLTRFGQPPEWYSLNPFDPTDLNAKQLSANLVFNPLLFTQPIFSAAQMVPSAEHTTVSAASILPGNEWLGADFHKSAIPGIIIYGSHHHKGDADVGSISLQVKIGDTLFYRSGPTGGRQFLEIPESGSYSVVLPVALDWVQLAFSSKHLPDVDFTITLSDQGDGFGEWSAIAVKKPDEAGVVAPAKAVTPGLPAEFDPKFYVTSYPDLLQYIDKHPDEVAAAGDANQWAINHYLTHGKKEGRVYRPASV